MKKFLSFLLIFVLLLGVAGCGAPTQESDKLQVICTVFPQYDWVRNIIGETDGIKLTLLMDNGADLHNYQPSVADLSAIAACDLFIYTGGASDEWVADALLNCTNPSRKVIDLMQTIEEPLCTDHDHGEHEHHEGEEYDEHIWLSLKNADLTVKKIAEMLGEIDPENAETYTANADAYRAKLTQLDKEYRETVDNSTIKTLVFADRFPFAYLFRDYGLHHHAAFTGCSAETEASFATISTLAQKVDELKLRAVMVIETSDQSIARTVVQNTKTKDQQILVLDSMQSVTQKRIDAGETYLGIMENNLKILKNALAMEIKLWLN